jgi:5-methylcytosine-specific restriction endonuclease McrA
MEKSPATHDERCGTYAGYKAHRKRNEELCQPCRDAMNQYRREHIKNNPGFNARHKQTYKEKNKEYIEYSGKLVYQAKKQKQLVLETYGTDCYICSEPIDLDAKGKIGRDPYETWQKAYWVDHVLPIRLGGTSDISNLRPSHAQCNINKGFQERKIS